jgi:hypothetical protein
MKEKIATSAATNEERVNSYADTRPEASEIKQLEQADNPNAEAFQPADLAYADCSEQNELPGVQLLSSGFDPELMKPCNFDECRTTRLFDFTYTNDCKRVLTSGGVFKIPDQVTVLNKCGYKIVPF